MKPVKVKSHVDNLADWHKYDMTATKYVYNGMADHAVGEFCKKLVNFKYLTPKEKN